MGKGNIIGKANEPTTLKASGVWSLQEQYNAKKNNIWPLAEGFTNIANYFAGQNFSLYDFRPGSDSIFSDTGLTTPITSGGELIAGVKDLGTNGRNLTQSTSGNSPTSVTDGAATFNGSSNFLDSSSLFNIQTCVIVAQLNTGTNSFTGIVTNLSDQATNVDFAFTTAGSNWDSGQTAGGGLANSTHFWRNKSTQTRAVTFDTLCAYSCDATGNVNTLNFPVGLRVGRDRSLGRYLSGAVGAIFIHSDSILSDTDRNYVEDQFNSVFSLY